jgi:hypothetical protein
MRHPSSGIRRRSCTSSHAQKSSSLRRKYALAISSSECTVATLSWLLAGHLHDEEKGYSYCYDKNFRHSP